MKAMNKEQTAVHWLEGQLILRRNATPIVDKDLFDKAKEMECQQIMDAFDDGEETPYLEMYNGSLCMINPNQNGGVDYYEKKYEDNE